jgi:hypothetical protein
MIAKGRDAFGWMSRGENNGHTHLTDEQVLDIRRQLAAGVTQREVAEQYQITQTNVSAINVGKSWTHLLPDDYTPAKGRCNQHTANIKTGRSWKHLWNDAPTESLNRRSVTATTEQ